LRFSPGKNLPEENAQQLKDSSYGASARFMKFRVNEIPPRIYMNRGHLWRSLAITLSITIVGDGKWLALN
jgi:hypothetical protein